MFKEKRFIHREKMNGGPESSENLQSDRWEKVTPSVNKANKAIEAGEKWAKEASDLKSKIGENPTKELEEKYDQLIKSLEDLNNGVEKNTNKVDFQNLLNNFDQNVSDYEKLTSLTKDFVEKNESEAARLENLGKKSKEEIKEEKETAETEIAEAEANIKETIAKGGTTRKNRKNIKEAVENIATLLPEDDPRVKTKYWLTLAREEGELERWKAEYAGQEIANNNIDNLI